MEVSQVVNSSCVKGARIHPQSRRLLESACPFPRNVFPSLTTLLFRSTRNQNSNFLPIIGTVRFYDRTVVLHRSACRLLLLSSYPYLQTLGQCWDPRHRAICDRQARLNFCQCALVPYPSACCLRLLSIYPCDGGIQDIHSSVPTLTICSTRNQRCNFTPILATVRLHYILQYVVFVFCPITPTSSRPVDAGIQDNIPFVTTLFLTSTWNQSSNCRPICFVLPIVPFLGGIRNCTSQMCIFVCCPATSRASRHTIWLCHGIYICIIVISGRRRKTYRNVR
jgi:hypothetical protein